MFRWIKVMVIGASCSSLRQTVPLRHAEPAEARLTAGQARLTFGQARLTAGQASLRKYGEYSLRSDEDLSAGSHLRRAGKVTVNKKRGFAPLRVTQKRSEFF